RERWAAQRPGKSHQPQLAAEDEDKEDDEDDEDDEELDASQETRPASVLGIGLRVGLRNLALSLAIGTAFALDNPVLGAFLVAGFALHCLLSSGEVVTPLTQRPPSIWRLFGLLLLMGLPAAGGLWLGVIVAADIYAQLATAIFLAVGGGVLAFAI